MAETKKYPVLKVGSKGPEVKMLKIALKEKGYNIDLSTDEYDNNTKEIVEKVQQEDPAKMNKDGIAGEQTWSYLEADLGKELLNPVVNTADAKPPYKWIDVKESSVKPDINTLNNLATYQTGTILGDKPTTTTITPKESTGNGLWDGLSLGQYEKLAGSPTGGFYQPLLPPGYSVSEAAREKLNAEQQEGSQNKNDLMSYLMDKLGENLKNNKQDVITDRAFNDTISIGEMINNLNEPPYEDVSKIEAGKIQAVKMSNDTMIDNIDRQKNSQIKYMRSIGRQDLIPSIVAATDNKKAEMAEQLNNTNANLENAARQTNLQTETQTKATNTGIDQFNRQMFERAEMNKGAAVSQNLTNLRNSSRDFTNNMTGVRDNDLSYLMYMAASEDPKLKDALSNYMYQQSRRRKSKENQYIYNAQGVDQNGNSIIK